MQLFRSTFMDPRERFDPQQQQQQRIALLKRECSHATQFYLVRSSSKHLLTLYDVLLLIPKIIFHTFQSHSICVYVYIVCVCRGDLSPCAENIYTHFGESMQLKTLQKESPNNDNCNSFKYLRPQTLPLLSTIRSKINNIF